MCKKLTEKSFFICVYQKNVYLCAIGVLYDSSCDVFGFGEIEFLTDLGFALVDGL